MVGELRHDRASIRAHRERIIKKKKKLFDALWVGGYTGEGTTYYKGFVSTPAPLGKLAKHSTHHHKCSMCSPRYNRAQEKKLSREF